MFFMHFIELSLQKGILQDTWCVISEVEVVARNVTRILDPIIIALARKVESVQCDVCLHN